MSDPASTSHYRSSKVQRDETEARLRETYLQGHLTLDELNSRAERIHDDSTIGDLDALLVDVPQGASSREPAAVPAVSRVAYAAPYD